jgi:periplasmic protein CpxP/Spy
MGHGMKMGQGMKMRGQMADPAARLTALKTELAITPAQEPAWSIYTKVVVDTATAQKAQHEKIDRDAVHKMEPNDRQAFRTGQQTQRQAAMATVKTAADALLAVLDEPQKAKARESLPGLVDLGAGPMRHGMMGGHGMKGGMPGSSRPQ